MIQLFLLDFFFFFTIYVQVCSKYNYLNFPKTVVMLTLIVTEIFYPRNKITYYTY